MRPLEPLLVCAALLLPAATAIAQAAGDPAAQAQLREVRVPEQSFSRGDPLPAWAAPVGIPAATQKKPVVIRLADTQLHVEPFGVFVNRAVQVNDVAALGQIGQYPLHFVPEYQQLRLHSVRVLRGGDASDRTHTVNVRFLQRETGLEYGTYSGVVTAMLLLEDIRVGDSVHVVYSLEGSNPVFGGVYSDFASWDQAAPIEHRRVTLTHPTRRNIQWRMLGDIGRAELRPEVTVADGMTRLRFEETSVPGVDFEPDVPASFMPYRLLQFTEYRDWNAVAKWAEGLFSAQAQSSPELTKAVERLRGLPSPELRVSAALQWVQDEIRYFSVALGESSHRPSQPDVVLKRRYGDCKDKSFLLVNLLNRLGIEARPVLVSAQARNHPAKFLPTPLAFDHVVVHVRHDESSYYLDPARLGQRGRLSRMGQALENADVLIVAPGTTALSAIKTPNLADLVRSELEETMVLSAIDGDAELTARQKYVGVTAEVLRIAFAHLSPEQLQKLALEPYEQRYPGVTLAGEPRIEDDSDRNVITFTNRFRVPKAAALVRGDWILRFFPSNFRRSFKIPQVMARSFPVTLPSHPYEARYSLEVRWPENVSVLTDPTTRRVNGKHFNSEVTRSFRGNRAQVTAMLRTKTDKVEAADLQRLLADIREMDRLVGGVMIVAADSIKSDGFLGLQKKTLQDSLLARLKDAEKRTTETISSAGLQGHDLADAYCLRAETLADMGLADQGLKDAQEAVKLAPTFPRALQCRGNVHFAKGDFERAVADFTSALSLGGTSFRTFYRRGHARFYLGNYDLAVQDFEKASAHQADQADQLYADLWWIWTLQRLQKPIPPDLAARASQEPRGAWPRPALAMLAGVLAPGEMIDLVNRKEGDEREMILAEAWFYLGQHHMARNELAPARAAFEKSREKGITMFIEHVAAGFELQKIGAAK